MKKCLWTVLVGALLLWPGALLVAHVRLIHPSTGTGLRWSSPANVGIVISAAGSDDISDQSHQTALRMAIREWNNVTGATAALVEDASAASQARSDWEADDIHLIAFDETNASGFFPNGSPTVAITPVWFSGSGVITDADVLFNGSAFQFATDDASGRFDVEDVATHELGHLLGLDHSGSTGASMYPYVDQNVLLQRSLSQDDVDGLRDAYPSATFGQITGTILRAADSTAVQGAYVVARDAAGRTRASILGRTNGTFTLRGLDPGTYTVYARPFDSTVTEANVGSGYAGHIDTDFQPAVYATTATISTSQTVALGTLAVGGDANLNLGAAVDTLPVRAIAGQSQTVFLHGAGLFVGSTLTASDPDLILGSPSWLGTQIFFQLTVPPGEARGHVDLTVQNAAGELAILPAALEITPLDPSVLSVAPTSGTVNGGSALTITGTDFEPGSRVVIGDRIYTDGTDATVVDANTITLTTAATAAGVHPVVVIDSSGVEGRLDSAFTVLSAPGLHKVLPHAGSSAGGTQVVLDGEGFLDGMVVRIDGIDQGPVTVESPALARFTTTGGAPGGPYVLEVENPDGALASEAFAYAAQSDPTLTLLAPAAGSAGGGTLVTLSGTSFTATMSVSFLADPSATPVPATSVTYLDANTLEVVTPAYPKGPACVLVADANEVGVFAEDAFTFTGKSGGGGCYMVPYDGPITARRLLENAWWIAAVLTFAWMRGRRGRRVLAPA